MEQLLILLDDGVLGLGQDTHQRRLVQVVERDRDRQPPYELRNQPELQQIIWDQLGEGRVTHFGRLFDGRLKAHQLMTAQPLFDDLVEPFEGAAADEQDVLCIDLDEILMRMLASTLRRHIGHRALDDLQERLLDALTGDIARDGGIVRLAGDLIDLIDIDDAAFRPRHIKVGHLNQAQQNILDILTDVAGLRQGGGVGDAERDVQNLGERLCQQRLTTAGRPDEQNVALAQLDIVNLHAGVDTLVMVVDGDREGLLRPLLADDVLVELVINLAGRGHLAGRDARLRGGLLFLDDLAAEVDTLVADVDPTRTRDQPLHLILALAAEGATVCHTGALCVRHVVTIPSCPPRAAWAAADEADRELGLVDCLPVTFRVDCLWNAGRYPAVSRSVCCGGAGRL